AALFGALLVVLALLPPSEERLPPLTVFSAGPFGGKALRLWLEGLGYRVTTLESASFSVPDGTGTLLVLAPTRPFSRFEMDELERWIRGGGVLLLAADGTAADSLLDRFGMGLRALPLIVESATPALNGALDPSIGPVLVQASDELLLRSSGATPLLSEG